MHTHGNTLIQDILDIHISDENEKKLANRDANKYSVSDSGKCRLMRYKKLKSGSFEAFPPDTLRIFSVGNLFHEYIQDVLSNYGMTHCEYRMEDEHRIGHLDMIVKDWQGRHILFDIKTTNDRTFGYKVKGDIDRHHKYQVLSYADMFRTHTNNEIEIHEVRMLYVRKNDFAMAERTVPQDAQTLAAIREDWDIMIKAKVEDTPPEANPQEDWECRYCPFQPTCEVGNPALAKEREKKILQMF